MAGEQASEQPGAVGTCLLAMERLEVGASADWRSLRGSKVAQARVGLRDLVLDVDGGQHVRVLALHEQAAAEGP